MDRTQTVTVPVPVGGLNLNDALANMPLSDAYRMDNVFPGQSYLEVRSGYTEHATGAGTASVSTVVSYRNGATNQLIVGGSGTLYNASTSGTTATAVGSGYTVNTWSTVMQGGSMIMVNGADTPQKYNGTAASAATYTGAGTPANFIKVNQYRSRLYFTETGTLGYYYGGVQSQTGALTAVSLTSQFKNGGQLLWTATFTRDAGDGQDDLFVAASDANELLVYEGAYPDDPSWTKIGLYQIPTLLGRDSYLNLGGDLLLLTSAGILPLSSIMQMGTVVNNNQKVSNKINQIFPFLASNYGTNAGWQMRIYPKGQYLLVNVPISPGSTYQQYICNLQTGAWCRFTSQNGPAWGVYSDGLYFGGLAGQVYLADNGQNDDGDAIVFDWRQAYSKYNYENNKLFNMIQPNYTSGANLALSLDVDPDFKQSAFNNTVQSSSGGGTPWGSPWGSPWASDKTYNDWQQIGSYGVYGSIRMMGSVTNADVQFSSNRLMYEPGGQI